LFDNIVVGSGPAGSAAALTLKNKNTLILDVGFSAPEVPDFFCGDVYELIRNYGDLFPQLVGDNFEGMYNLFSEKKISLKLKSPYMSFILRRWKELSPVKSSNFEGMISLSRGGLANAWGAGVYRFTDRDLYDFPIDSSELTPYYDALTSHIGISGTNDDLVPFFLKEKKLLESINLSKIAQEFLNLYEKNRNFFNANNLFVGRSRIAVLTSPYNGREKYPYDHMEFFKPNIQAIYTPAFTMNKLIEDQAVTYFNNTLVKRFEEKKGYVQVYGKNIETGQDVVFKGKRLFIGAGTQNTSRIVLASNNDKSTRLPILDNPMTCFPLLRPGKIGHMTDENDASIVQLNMIYDDVHRHSPVQMSFFGTNGPLRTDVLFDLPLPVTSSIKLLKYLSAATALVMMFYPGKRYSHNYLKLGGNGELIVNYERDKPDNLAEKLIPLFRKIGYFSSTFLVKHFSMGTGLHYAGSLPMKKIPERYECNHDGLLHGTNDIYIIDGACFTSLPSKNLTFTIMANAMRIAEKSLRQP